MIVGDPSVFALESEVSVVYAGPGATLWPMGFFQLHLAGASFGVREPDASVLSCSFDAVGRRLRLRGHHDAPFTRGTSASHVARAVRRALYFAVPEEETFFGMSQALFAACVHERDLLWVPDGDEAFDDGSYVLQLDQEDEVRLIGFRSIEGDAYEQGTLREVELSAETFYGLLHTWASGFEAEWQAMPRMRHPGMR